MEGPVAEPGAHLLVDVCRLTDAIDGDIGIGEDKRAKVLRAVDHVFIDQHLDALLQHCPVFGGLLALRLFITFPVAVTGAAISFVFTALLFPLPVLLFPDPVLLFLLTVLLLLDPVLPLLILVMALLRTITLLLLPVVPLLFLIVPGLAFIAFGLPPVMLHLPHLAVLVIILHRGSYSFNNGIVFRQLVTRDEPVVDIDLRRLIIDVDDLIIMISDMPCQDVLSHRGEEDMIAVPDTVGGIVLAADAGRGCGKQEG